MALLRFARDAADDLHRLRATDIQGTGRILAVLEQIAADPNSFDRLLMHDYDETERTGDFSVKKWITAQERGFNLWRLKIWDWQKHNLPYRVIYAYDQSKFRFHILAIVHKDGFNYEPDHVLTARIQRAYLDLNITYC